MAGSLIGSLRISLGLDTAEFTDRLAATQKKLGAAGKAFQESGKRIATVGAVMSAGITAPFAALVSAAIPAAVESQKALAQVNAALASMGPVAGRTSEQLQKAAGSLQDLSNFDDDDILVKVTANLLTFGNVAGAQFDRAQLAAVNLSARLSTDLQSSALLVGKALNDPIKGLKSLSRVGIQFTADQKALIEGMVASGNAAGAQGIILTELERQFGGAAKAQRDATPDAAAQQAWRTFQETIGGLALKVLPPLTSVLTTVLNAFNNLSPGMQTAIVASVAFVAAVGPIAVGIGAIVSGIGLVLPAFAGLATFLSTTALPVIAAIGRALLGLAIAGGPLTLIAAAATAVYLVWKNWDTIGPILERLYTAAKTYLMDKLGGVMTWVTDKVKAVGDAFYKLWDRVVGHSYVPDLVDGIGEWFGKLGDVMVDPVLGATDKAAESFANLAQSALGSVSTIIRAFKSGNIGGAIGGVKGLFETLAPALKLGSFSDASIVGKSGTLSAVASGLRIPGLASGGTIGGFGGIDRNLLSINGAPVARVGRGEMIRVEPNNDNGRGGVVINAPLYLTGAVDLATKEEANRFAYAHAQEVRRQLGDSRRRSA